MPDGVDDRRLVISGVAKARLKWTHQLHQRFVDAVSQLGGVDKATPKSVMRVMGIPGITLHHLKSHLQKYRLSRSRDHNANSRKEDIMAADYREAENANQSIFIVDENKSPFRLVSSKSMLQLQMEVQRRLQEQIEVQKHLQLRIEAQGKYLQSVLRKAQETIAGYNLNLLEVLETEHTPNGTTDCSADSCLTSSDFHNGKQHNNNNPEISDCSENWSYSKEVELESGEDEFKGEKRKRSVVQMEHIEIDLNR